MTRIDDRDYRMETLDAYRRGVERAIQMMQERLSEPLTVDDLADAAFMSRFHFSRVFTMITGVSPARFLAAMRIQEAKILLLKTDQSVTNVSLNVGYSSLGTFTRIFSDFVGFPPVRFRQLCRPLLGLTLDQVARFLPPPKPTAEPTVCGQIVCSERVSLVVVAMFPTAIPRSHPIECICLVDSLRFSFCCRPTHGHGIFAVGLLPAATLEDSVLMSQTQVLVGSVRVSKHSTGLLSLHLQARQKCDPPPLIAFPLLIVESSLGRPDRLARI